MDTVPVTTGLPKSREELLRRATDLVPLLRERASRTEQLRQIPPETVEAIVASGLVRVGNPDRFGGLGIDIDASYDVAWELGRGCGSTAWCYSLWAIHNWWAGHFSERAQQELFAGGPDTLVSTGLNPAGARAEKTPDGYRLSGRWGFSSGCDASSWAMLGIPGPPPDGRIWLLVPRADYEIVDTWFAAGMKGSGSKDIAVKDTFVPFYRSLDPNQAGDGEFTGWELHGRLSYRVPLRVLTGWDLAAPLIGIAQGAVDEFTSRLHGTSGPGRTADSVALQLRLAEAAAEVDAARLIHRHTVAEMLDRAARGAPFPELDRVRYRRDKSFVAKLCVQAVNRLFEAAGARSILDSDAIQRFHRDTHGASHHFSLSWDTPAEQFGRVALGLPAIP